jgi:hypothetical protein
MSRVRLEEIAPASGYCSQEISLAYPCEEGGDLLLAHDDYYLPLRQLEEEEGGYSTPSSHFIAFDVFVHVLFR